MAKSSKQWSLSDLPAPDREKVLPDQTRSMVWTSGGRTARLRLGRDTVRLDVFRGKDLIWFHGGTERETRQYCMGYILAFKSCPQPS